MSVLHRISTSAGGDRVADVLFLHGLGGDAFATDAHLADLYDWYRNQSARARIETFTYFETREVSGFRIVARTSSHPGVGPDPVGLDEDHISISKPRDRNLIVPLLCKRLERLQ